MNQIFVAQHQDSGGDAPPESSRSISESLDEVRTNFDALKAQYSTLLKVMQVSFNEATQQVHPPLPFTAEEEEHAPSHHQRVSTSVTGISFRDSTITSSSGSFVEWFDADEGPQEFVMELGQDMSEPPSRMLSTADERDTSSIDTDFEEPDTLSSTQEIIYRSFGDPQVVRRAQLPCLPPSDEGSLFAILKKNVGKVRAPFPPGKNLELK